MAFPWGYVGTVKHKQWTEIELNELTELVVEGCSGPDSTRVLHFAYLEHPNTDVHRNA